MVSQLWRLCMDPSPGTVSGGDELAGLWRRWGGCSQTGPTSPGSSAFICLLKCFFCLSPEEGDACCLPALDVSETEQSKGGLHRLRRLCTKMQVPSYAKNEEELNILQHFILIFFLPKKKFLADSERTIIFDIFLLWKA